MESEHPLDPRQDTGKANEADRAASSPHIDQFAPPAEPCECFCLHCNRTFMSDQIWLQRVRGGRKGFEGFWMCPTPNCSGAGFTFDIFPTDPAHPANDGWFHNGEPRAQRDWDDDDELEFAEMEDELEDTGELTDEPETPTEWNPDEPQYKMLEDAYDDEDDIEGEEWKYGLAPGSGALSDSPSPMSPLGIEDEYDDPKYDQPDRRPREIDASDCEPKEPPEWGSSGDEEDDIPF